MKNINYKTPDRTNAIPRLETVDNIYSIQNNSIVRDIEYSKFSTPDKTFEVLKFPSISELVNNFNTFLAINGVIDFQNSKNQKLRMLMIEYFRSKKFLNDYFFFAEEIIEKYNLDRSKVLLQKSPTPRIYRPGDHGTSFHSDYWYGHGEHSITIWTPLNEVNPDNSFNLISSSAVNEKYFSEFERNQGIWENEEELIQATEPALPLTGESICFSSKVIHGSPRNLSDKVRVSFDFRIAYDDDSTSTKDLISYFKTSVKSFSNHEGRFKDINFIKYICGGALKSTLAQHVIIEAVAKEYGLTISGQEAELERFGQPIFKEYLNGLAKKKKFNGVVIASKSILDETSIFMAKNNKNIKVYCALENEFL